jgi:L-ascorbate metabolism protein UlaG (beta-lactamase superfamily)
MVINYRGQNCFDIQNGELSLLIDPPNNRLKANIILKTEVSLAENELKNISANEFPFPGEYEIKGIHFRGFPASVVEKKDKETKTVFLVEWEDFRLAFLGKISSVLLPDILEEIAETDILFLPVGEKYLTPEIAKQIIKQVEPKIIIPEIFKGGEKFLKLMEKKPELQNKLVIKRKDIEKLKNEVIILKPLS